MRKESSEKAEAPRQHHYISTACQHDMHDQCRIRCKFCGEKCACTECVHDWLRAEAPPSHKFAAAQAIVEYVRKYHNSRSDRLMELIAEYDKSEHPEPSKESGQ